MSASMTTTTTDLVKHRIYPNISETRCTVPLVFHFHDAAQWGTGVSGNFEMIFRGNSPLVPLINSNGGNVDPPKAVALGFVQYGEFYNQYQVESSEIEVRLQVTPNSSSNYSPTLVCCVPIGPTFDASGNETTTTTLANLDATHLQYLANAECALSNGASLLVLKHKMSSDKMFAIGGGPGASANGLEKTIARINAEPELTWQWFVDARRIGVNGIDCKVDVKITYNTTFMSRNQSVIPS
jgi:hypothetical protein